MLDLTGIMFSSSIMLFVILRAVQLDRTMPWFSRKSGKIPDQPAPGRARQVLRPWQKRG